MRTTPLLPVLLGAALACACSAPSSIERRALRADSVRDAGSVHIAVLAVAPWSDYEQALLPRFDLTAEEARDRVLRSSLSEIEAGENRMGVAIAAVEDESEKAPSAPSTNTPSGPSARVSVPKDRPDAMLEYWNATSLFQEVQLLNRTLLDAAVPSDHTAYLVRLQVSLMPRRRHQPYDVYTTLSFFPGAFGGEDGGSADGGSVDGGSAGSARRTAPTTVLRGGSELASGGPRVVPLLVSDNLEVSDVSRSQSEVRRLALSLAAFPGDFATSTAADLLSNSFAAEVAGRDLNSLMTVARVSENTLRVRIGAMREPTAGYAMVPRNHYVTLLLTVPNDAAETIQVVSRTELVDAESGARLAGTSEREIAAAVATIRREYDLDGLSDEAFAELLAHAQRNDPSGFRDALSEAVGANAATIDAAQSLWVEAVSLMAGSRWAGTWIELPGQGRWQIDAAEFEGQTAVCMDDGERTSVDLVGARFAEGVSVGGRLILFDGDFEIAVPATQVDLVPESRRVRLSFPSLERLGLADLTQAPFGVALIWPDDRAEFDGLYVPVPAAPQGAPASTP